MKLINTFKLIVIAILAFSLVSCEEEEQEREITAKEVPQAVLQVFNQAYPGAAIKEYAEEKEDGQTLYEISCVFEGRRIDAIYKPDGTVAAIEEVIAAEQLPNNIHQAIAREFQQFSIQLAEKLQKEGKQFFEVKLLNTKDQKKYELLFSDTGKLIEKEEIKSAEEEEKYEKESEEKEEEEEEEEKGEIRMNIAVPEKIIAAFNAKYAAATNLNWGKESDTEYEAEFKLNGKVMSANFDATGKWLETECILKKEDLPQPIMNTLKLQFGDYQVIKVESLEKPGVPMIFEVQLKKGETVVGLEVDESGMIANKETRTKENEDKFSVSFEDFAEGKDVHMVHYTFEETQEGALPEDFQTGMTGEWKRTEWRVKKVDGNAVLAHVGFWDEDPDGVFPVAWVKNSKARDLRLTVRLFPVNPPASVKGAIHDGTGIIVRFKNPDNYYLLRAVPHETRVRFYKVENGKRSTLAGKNIDVPTGQWHTLQLLARGNSFTAYFNGEELFTHMDNTFAEAGAFGLWCKPNNVTYYDNLTADIIE